MSEAAGTTGQHDTPQYYAVEQLRSAQSHLLELVQALVIWRARVEKYRTADLTAARDAFDALLSVRHDLVEVLGGNPPAPDGDRGIPNRRYRRKTPGRTGGLRPYERQLPACL